MVSSHDTDAKLAALQASGTRYRHAEQVTDELFVSSSFFDARDLVQVKYEMLRRVHYDGWSISRAAAQYGFSRPSFYQAQAAFGQRGLWGLLPSKRGPRQAHKLTAEVMAYLQGVLLDQPALSSSELVQLIAVRFALVVHPRSLERRLQDRKKKRL